MNDKTAYALNLVRQALARYTDTPAEQIQPESSLIDLQIDSLTLAELLFELEDRLGATISESTTAPRLISDILMLVEPFIDEQALRKVV